LTAYNFLIGAKFSPQLGNFDFFTAFAKPHDIPTIDVMKKAKLCKWLTIRDQFINSNLLNHGPHGIAICDQVKKLETKLEKLTTEVQEINTKFNIFSDYQESSSSEMQNQLQKIFEILQNKNG